MALSLKALVKRFAREERGAAFVEYAMLTGLIAAVVVVVVAAFGQDIADMFGRIGGQMAVVNSTPVAPTLPTTN